MLRVTSTRRVGFIAYLRDLVAWNRGNAATALREQPTSDAPPVHLSPEELERITRGLAVSSASPSTTFSSSSTATGAGGGEQANKTAHSTVGGSSSSPSWSARSKASAKTADAPAFDPAFALSTLESVLRARRSTKVFDCSRPVDAHLIQRLLATTTTCPTANNLQPWHAIVVHEDTQRRHLCEAALGQQQIMTAPFAIVFAGDTEASRYAPAALELGLSSGAFGAGYGPSYLRSVYYHLHGGPLQSMAVAKHLLSSLYSARTGTPLLSVPLSTQGYAWKQTMIPATTFVYLATAAGLDTCIMEGIDEDAVKRVVGLPARFTVPVIVAVGYAAEEGGFGSPRRPPTPRFAVRHMVRWGRY